MWAQLIQVGVKPGQDPSRLSEPLRAAEPPGSGLVRTLLMRDQHDASRIFALVVFESEEQARARERDPQRAEQLASVREMQAEIYEGAPVFTDLDVLVEWTGD